MNPGLRTNIIQQTLAWKSKTLKNTEFPKALNYTKKSTEERTEERVSFFWKMFYIFDDSRKKKQQEYRSFFSSLIAGDVGIRNEN